MLVLMAILLISGLTSAEAPRFYAGLLPFTKDNLSRTAQVGKLTKPISILSLASLEFYKPFGLLVTRKMYNRRKSYFLQVNVTVDSFNKQMLWNMEVHYLLVRQLANIEVHSLNITTHDKVKWLKPQYLDIKSSRCILFPLGFSSSSLVQNVKAHRDKQSFVVYRKQTMTLTESKHDNWLLVEAVIFQQDSQQCGHMEPQEYELDFHQVEKNLSMKNRTQDLLLSNSYLYVPGINEFHHYSNGSIKYLQTAQQIQVYLMGFTYSMMPINDTCMYVAQSSHATVFVVLFWVFSGISIVLIAVLMAYCVIKRFDKRHAEAPIQQIQPHPQIQVEHGLPQAVNTQNEFVHAGSRLTQPAANLLPPSTQQARG